jgi:hypothetical protein
MTDQRTYVVLATPSFGRTPCLEYDVAISETQSLLTKSDIDYVVSYLGADPYLPKARNRLAGQFLTDHPKATHLFFLDDDIGWPAAKVVEFLKRPEDIVCGIYPKKEDATSFPVTLELENHRMIERDGLYRAKLVPTGFMRIRRHVIEKMAARSMKYTDILPNGEARMFWEIFQARLVDPKMEELRRADLDALSRGDAIAYLKRSLGVAVPSEMGTWWGEDYFFAERWREMGGEVWVDPEIEFTHRGSKAWKACFGDSVRATAERDRRVDDAAGRAG